MSGILELKVPISKRQVGKLKVGDAVYLSGSVYTVRDMAYERALELVNKKKRLPFDLQDGAIWHCGPIVKKVDDSWKVLSAGSTTSGRFTWVASRLIPKLDIRLVIGKGGMGHTMANAMCKHGAAYLSTTGGCAALYARQIKKVKNVFWPELGMPAAVWVFEADKLGPLTVMIDSHGNSLYNTLIEDVKKRKNNIYHSLGIDPKHQYYWWPPKRSVS